MVLILTISIRRLKLCMLTIILGVTLLILLLQIILNESLCSNLIIDSIEFVVPDFIENKNLIVTALPTEYVLLGCLVLPAESVLW